MNLDNTTAPLASITSEALSTGEALSDQVVDAVSTHATDLATGVAVPAAKFAAARLVKGRVKTLIVAAAVLVAVPVIVNKIRARKSGDTTGKPAAESNSTETSKTTEAETTETETMEDIPTVESRVGA